LPMRKTALRVRGLTAIILRRGEFETAGSGPPFLSF
jgi:hypothetical protein